MTEEEARARLLAVDFCMSRLIHDLRTPLGTSLSVMNDIVDGLEVTDEDLYDGQLALRKIKASLDRAAVFSRKPGLIKEVMLSSVILAAVEESRGEISCTVGGNAHILCDPEYLTAGFVALFDFLSQDSAAPMKLSLLRPGTITIECLCAKRWLGKSFNCLAEMGAAKQTIDGVLLLFSELVVSLYGGKTCITNYDARLIISVDFEPVPDGSKV
jgi:hypothetical protein